MSDFNLWFGTGFWHIASIEAYDHLLFVSLLVFAFPFNEWKKLLVLITAFTLGHSLSLALSTTGLWRVQRNLTECCIALSILITAVYQLLTIKKSSGQKLWLIYLVTGLFGLIHGLGFSYLLSAMLGREASVLLPLLYFNLGIELGQLCIVALVILFSLLLTSLFKWSYQNTKYTILCITAFIALLLCAERLQAYYQS